MVNIPVLRLLLLLQTIAFVRARSILVYNQSTLDSLAAVASCQINATPNIPDLAGVDYATNVKTARVPLGRTYRFVHYNTTQNKPYILFLHGFPSTSYDWRRQFKFFSDKGYGIIAPDLLGFGGTDKPTDVQAYRLKPMIEELVQLLDCIDTKKVHVVSHDWGSLLHSRLITYDPERILSTTFLDIGYFAPPLGLNSATATAMNAATRLTLGYPVFGYWFFFNQSDAALIMDAHPHSASTLMYANDQSLQSKNFCDQSALQSWLQSNKTAPPSPWLPATELAAFERITATNGGYFGGLQWYKAIVNNINSADEAAAALSATKQIKVPTLLITATKDPIGLPFFARTLTTPFASRLTERSVESGHFLQVEQADGVNQYIADFLTKLA